MFKQFGPGQLQISVGHGDRWPAGGGLPQGLPNRLPLALMDSISARE